MHDNHTSKTPFDTSNLFLSLPEKIARSVSIEPQTGCWEWNGSTSAGGYGRVRYYNEILYCHRAMYELTYGPIPEGMFVCHHCDNRSCCNPEHLFLGTPKDNTSDRDNKKRQARGETGGNAKLTEARVTEIRYLRSCGWTLVALGEAFGVSRQTITRTVRGETWKHVK